VDLVEEDARKPGAERRASVEGIERFERGEERVLYRLFGQLVVAHAGARVAQQVAGVLRDFRREDRVALAPAGVHRPPPWVATPM
jgi:hypothetical protein